MFSQYKPVAFVAAGVAAFALSAGTSLAASPAKVSVTVSSRQSRLTQSSRVEPDQSAAGMRCCPRKSMA